MGAWERPEPDLMQSVREQDEQAFEVLFNRYKDGIRRHLIRTLRDEEAAHDLLQEVFLRLWTHADRWDGRGSLKAWLYRIATNLAFNHLRTVRRRRERPLEIPAESGDEDNPAPQPGWLADTASPAPEEVVQRAEERRLLERLVTELPADKRAVFRLIYEADMDIREVAESLGIPEGTVRSRLFYARKCLAQQWRDYEHEWEEK
ncbi:MAG: RNA polymerase sigma factor [Armatimonadetes bacterium]|nr:RNA polymerase sigma factor [Armatimonadota bacterium]